MNKYNFRIQITKDITFEISDYFNESDARQAFNDCYRLIETLAKIPSKQPTIVHKIRARAKKNVTKRT